MNYNNAPHVSLSRQWGDQGRRVSDVEGTGGDGPPRKRMRGELQQTPNVMSSPGSPDIRLPGQRSRMPRNGAGLSISSEESMAEIQDIFDNSLKPRIIRGQPDLHGPTTSVIIQADTEDPKLTRFALTMPEHRKDIVRLAWQQTDGDARKASGLLQDKTWLRNLNGSAQPSSEVVGRVREIDEATKAQRAAAREMGKNSLIYANRPAPRISTPPASKGAIPAVSSPVTPLSPDVSRPRIKRTKKIIVDSDSETELEDMRHISKRQKIASDESRALDYLNNAGLDGLQELTGSGSLSFTCTSGTHIFWLGCTPPQAAKIIGLRPFHDVDDLNTKLGQGRKKAGPGGISPRMFEDCITIFEGYGMVDGILEDCEEIGASLRDAIASWTSGGTKGKGKQKEDPLGLGVPSRGSPTINQVEDGTLSLVSLEAVRAHATKDFIATQPSSLKEGTVLKDYQLLGINWLNLLYRQDLSCILADEMGALIQLNFFHPKHEFHLLRAWKDNSSDQFFCPSQRTGQQRASSRRRSVSNFTIMAHFVSLIISFVGHPLLRIGYASSNSLHRIYRLWRTMQARKNDLVCARICSSRKPVQVRLAQVGKF